MVAHLDARLWFPDPREAVPSGSSAGLVAVGGDLSIERLVLAYRSGIFPWTVRPISWWSPDPRAVIELACFRPPESLRRVLRSGVFHLTIDAAFQDVIAGCAEPTPRRPQTWISPEFIEAYTRLHEAGFAHSIECWQDDRLVGGIYGVAIGGLFSGESMFHRVSNASKVALHRLVEHLRLRGYRLFDIQMTTPVTEQLGAVGLPRAEYLRRLRGAVDQPVTFGVNTGG